jgi:hypothetical protein
MTNHLGLKIFSDVCKHFEQFSTPVSTETNHCKTFISGGQNAQMNYVFDLDANNLSGLADDFALLKSTGIPMIILSETQASESFNQLFAQQGITFIGSAQSKYNSLDEHNHTPSSEIIVQKVSTDEMMNTWRQLAATNFNYPLGCDDLLFNNFMMPGKHHDAMELFIAYLDGEAAGQSMLVFCGDSSANMWSSVLPGFRKRGVLTEMVNHRNAIAKSRGCKQSIVQCMPSSAAVYDRLGYQNAESFNLYLI